MNGQKPRALGQQLMDAMEKNLALQVATSDPEKKKQLSTSRKKLSAEAGRLIDAALDASTAEYQAAAKGLEEACALADEAIKDVNSVQAAIDALGKAADLAAAVVA